jgi:diguanylate cyclase (GGDEF)-like protein/PAS domain S-box-containing protein
MLDAALDAHVVMDAEGRITRWNAQAEAMFGWRHDEIVGKELAATLVPPEFREAHRKGLANYLKSGDGPILRRRVEMDALRKNGISFPVELTVAPIGTTDGPAFSAFLRDISERRQVEQQLRRLAMHDALTGLPNRLLLYDRAEQAFANAKRTKSSVALLLMDLDGFKDINDAYGHHVGDILLQEVSVRIREPLRESDTVARLGGDEFAMLLPDTDLAGALAAAKTLRASLDAPLTIEGVRMPVGSSIGVALFPSGRRRSADAAPAADIAMYVAKRRGTGIALYEEGSDLEGAARLGLASDLREALERGDLHLHYQPVIDLATKRVCMMEALARWDHPRLGLVSPTEFIPLAERSGVMPLLSTWALATALTKARDWYARGISIAVNMAVSDLSDTTFPDRVRASGGGGGCSASDAASRSHGKRRDERAGADPHLSRAPARYRRAARDRRLRDGFVIALVPAPPADPVLQDRPFVHPPAYVAGIKRRDRACHDRACARTGAPRDRGGRRGCGDARGPRWHGVRSCAGLLHLRADPRPRHRGLDGRVILDGCPRVDRSCTPQ